MNPMVQTLTYFIQKSLLQINGTVPPELNLTNPKTSMTREMGIKAQKQDPALN